MINSSDMMHTLRHSAALILLFNAVGSLAQSPHEIDYIVGCFVNGTAEVQFEFDNEEILYVDFSKEELIYTVPAFIDPDPSHILKHTSILRDALKNKDICLVITFAAAELKNPPEEREPPEIILYPSEDVQPGVENMLICFVNNFYPPSINVSWTNNGLPVSEGVSLSRYFSNNDQTFHQFSTLTFTPSEGDIYSCTVEHPALETPKTRIWEQDKPFDDQSLGPDVFCAVGLALGLLGVTTGVYFFVKAQHEQ